MINLLVSFLRLFIKRTEFIMQEGQVKYRVRGVTIGLFIFNYCIVGAWKEDNKHNSVHNSVGIVWFNQGTRLMAKKATQ